MNQEEEEEEEEQVMKETQTAALEVLGVTVALLAKAENVRFQRGASRPCPDAGEAAAHQSPWQPNGALQHGALMRLRASSR